MAASTRPRFAFSPLVRGDCLTFHRDGLTAYAWRLAAIAGLSRTWGDCVEFGVTVYVDGRFYDIPADFDLTFAVFMDWKGGAA